MDLFDAVDPEAAKAKQEKKEANKLVAAEKRKQAAKNKPTKPPKNKQRPNNIRQNLKILNKYLKYLTSVATNINLS
jgi:hypothetical protein